MRVPSWPNTVWIWAPVKGTNDLHGENLSWHVVADRPVGVPRAALPGGTYLGFQLREGWREVLFIGESRSQSHYSLRHRPDGPDCCMLPNGLCFPRHTASFIPVTFAALMSALPHVCFIEVSSGMLTTSAVKGLFKACFQVNDEAVDRPNFFEICSIFFLASDVEWIWATLYRCALRNPTPEKQKQKKKQTPRKTSLCIVSSNFIKLGT